MKVRVGIRGGIIVDNNVYSLDVNTATENVGSNKDALFEGLERGITTYTERNCQIRDPETEGNLDIPFLLGKA